jgi:hypothetical protein
MIPPISNPFSTQLSNQIPSGDSLMRAVGEYQKYTGWQNSRTQIQHGFDASNDRNSPRTLHIDFMAELKSEVMARINAR